MKNNNRYDYDVRPGKEYPYGRDDAPAAEAREQRDVTYRRTMSGEEVPIERPARPKQSSSRSRKKKFKRRFRKYVITLCFIFLAVLAAMWVLLGAYQKKQDAVHEAEAIEQQRIEEEAAISLAIKRAPQTAFSDWLNSADENTLAELWFAQHPKSLDDKAKVSEYLKNVLSSAELKEFKGLDTTESTPTFVVKNGDEEFIRVTMAGSELDWSVSEATLNLKAEHSASVTVAAGMKVICNGTALSDEYAEEAAEQFNYEPLKDKLVNPVKRRTYKVEDLLFEPEITFEAPTGMKITETADGNCYLCLDGEEAEGYQDTAVKFVKAYLYYYLSGLNGTQGNLYSALQYLEAGSDAYTELQDTYVGVVWNSAHYNINTDDTKAGGVVIWADNCYSIDITYKATGMVDGKADEYAATMRVYFTSDDTGAFGITHFETL